MRLLITILVSVAVAHHSTHGPLHSPVKLPVDYKQWTKVANCEEGGWFAGKSWIDRYGAHGYTFMGIDTNNWLVLGKRILGHVPALPRYRSRANRSQIVLSIRIGDLIEGGKYIPDQNNVCISW